MTATRCWRPSSSPAIPATTLSCPRRARSWPGRSRPRHTGRSTNRNCRTGRTSTAHSRPGGRGRSGQCVWRPLSVERHRHRLQCRANPRRARRHGPGRQPGAPFRSGRRREALVLRHFAARHAAGGVSGGTRLSRARPEEPRPRRSRQGAGSARKNPPLHPQVPFLAIHQRSGERRSLRGARLFGRCRAGAQPRTRGRQQGRDRFSRAEGGCDDVGRHARHPGRRAASRERVALHRLPAASDGDRRHHQRGRLSEPEPGGDALVDPAIRDDPAVYPPEDVRRRFYVDLPAPADYERARTRAWTRLKSGN